MCNEYLWEMRRAHYEHEYLAALGRYLRCVGGMLEARDAHAAAWDERLYQVHLAIEEAREHLFGKIDWPTPPPCGDRSAELQTTLFESRKTAMIFSEQIDQAFKKAGIKLGDNETYTCFFCVTEKPHYVSEALALDPLRQNRGGGARIKYVLEPTMMGAVMDALEKDKIDYAPRK